MRDNFASTGHLDLSETSLPDYGNDERRGFLHREREVRVHQNDSLCRGGLPIDRRAASSLIRRCISAEYRSTV
jgi:hypothetical protein